MARQIQEQRDESANSPGKLEEKGSAGERSVEQSKCIKVHASSVLIASPEDD